MIKEASAMLTLGGYSTETKEAILEALLSNKRTEGLYDGRSEGNEGN